MPCHKDERHIHFNGEMVGNPRYHSVGTSLGDAFNISTTKLSNDDIIIKSVNNSENSMSLDSMSRLELDSHANMPVVGASAQILAESGETVDVNAYSPEYEPRQVPLVDAALQYDSPYDGSTHILVIRNALYVPSMTNHLIPPFIMREAGIQVNDVPKIHQDDVDVSHHSIYFAETDLRIPLQLNGVFSYLPVSKPSHETLECCDDVYLLTPTRWNPHDEGYAANEENMLDWQGNLVAQKKRQRITLSDIPENDNMLAAVQIGQVETKVVEDLLKADTADDPKPTSML